MPGIVQGVIQPPSTEALPFTPPMWVRWLIALVPIFPPLYLIAFGNLKMLKTLPRTAKYMLYFFAVTQIVAALFTPDPLLSLGLTTLRVFFILAMISAGIYLRDSRNLRPLLWGQLAIFGTAWIYTLMTQGVLAVQERLGHPYYYVVSLGLVTVISLWIILFWKDGSLWWRIPIGIIVCITFLAAGSRGPLLALVIGTVAGFAFHRNHRYIWIFLVTAFLLFLSVGVARYQIPIKPIARLLNDQTSGRNEIWHEALEGWETAPIGGVGPYQGGPYLTFLFKDGCHLTPTLERNNINCPVSLNRWSSVWLIAHNAWLHWLLETGIIGLTGLSLLMAYILRRAFLLGDSLVIAILYGFTAMNIVDVVIAVPSPHFAELWWICVGISLVRRDEVSVLLDSRIRTVSPALK